MADVVNNPLQTWHLRAGDRRTPIAATLRGAAGSAIDLTGHTVRFVMLDDTGALVVDAAATIDSAAAGQVSYALAAADVDTAGTYWGWFVATRTSDGLADSFPADGRKLKIVIHAGAA